MRHNEELMFEAEPVPTKQLTVEQRVAVLERWVGMLLSKHPEIKTEVANNRPKGYVPGRDYELAEALGQVLNLEGSRTY